MPYKKASDSLNLDINLAAKSVKNSKNFISSSFITSLIAAIVCLPSLGRAARATMPESPKKTVNEFSSLTAAKSVDPKSYSKASILPNVSKAIASVKTPLANLSFPSANKERLSNPSLLNSTALKPNQLPNATSEHQTAAIASPSSTTVLAAKPKSQVHIVRRGDTISRIAKQYGVSRDELIGLNGIKNSNVIFVNQRLEIPAAKTISASERLKQNTQPGSTPTTSIPVQAVKESKTIDSTKLNRDRHTVSDEDPHLARLKAEIEQLRAQSRKSQQSNLSLNNPDFGSSLAVEKVKSTPTPAQNKAIDPASDSQSIPQEVLALQLPPLPPSDEYLPSAFEGYTWPAEGVLTSHYGWRWGRMHRGIDIAAPVGTPVVAAASGEVINAGWHSGYGNLIKLKHLDGSVTVYAHNYKIMVSHGQKVSQGEQIAEMGSTGRSTGSHLHFEIHSADKKSINPLALLGEK